MGRVVVTGGAGFLGSHLCDRFLDRGDEVIALDNFITGRRSNVAHLDGHDRFTLVECDVSAARRRSRRSGRRSTRSCTSPARRRPPTTSAYPIQTLQASAARARSNALELARAKGARFLLASTSEVYGDPEVHPQPESYWGHVNPVGPRELYDEAKRFAEAITWPTTAHVRGRHGIVRVFNTYGPRMRPERRPGGVQLHRAGAGGQADHDLRRRHPDPQLLLRRRRDRRHPRPARFRARRARSTSATTASSR